MSLCSPDGKSIGYSGAFPHGKSQEGQVRQRPKTSEQERVGTQDTTCLIRRARQTEELYGFQDGENKENKMKLTVSDKINIMQVYSTSKVNEILLVFRSCEKDKTFYHFRIGKDAKLLAEAIDNCFKHPTWKHGKQVL